MSDQLEAQLRAHIGRKVEQLAEQLNPDWHRSDSHALAVMNCADAASAPVAREIARLREREGALEGALRRAEQFIANGIEFGFIRMPDPDTPDPAHETLPAIRAALGDTAAPTPEEVER